MENPFLERAFHIRWSQLAADQVEAAMDAALQDAEGAITAITQLDPERVDYDGTFRALESATDLLNETWAKVSHLTSVADSPELRTAHNTVLPKVSAFQA